MIENTDETLALGGNIELSGFSGVDFGSMVIVKKMVGNYVKRFAEVSKDFQRLNLHLKHVHHIENSSKFEIHAKLSLTGRPVNAEFTDKNLFVCIDTVLKKVENEIAK